MTVRIKNLWAVGKILIIGITFLCASLHNSLAAEKLNVYTVNYPLKYFAEQIGQEYVSVVFPAPADIDPAYWMPDTKIVSDYQKADLILINGAGYAKWITKVTLPRFRMVNTSAGFKDRYIEADAVVTHSHGAAGEHAHESLAFTTWLDLELATQQAKAVADAFSRKKPGLKEVFQANYSSLEKDLLKLDQQINELTSKDPAKPLIGSHPVYDYFIIGYGLQMKSVHWEPDEAPNGKQWINLENILAKHPAQWMIWEGEPMDQSIEKLKSIGINSVVFDPCGNQPDQGDFLSVMRQNAKSLKSVFQ